MSIDRSKFPDYFPEGCPPDEASEEEMVVFRFCNNNPPASGDFLSYYEMGKEDKNYGTAYYGISVNYNYDEAKRLKQLTPFRRFKYIAEGLTQHDLGAILRTPRDGNPTHVTWWLYKDQFPHPSFHIRDRV